MARHSHQDALSETEFNRLLDACDELDEPYQTETRFALIAMGRLGLRCGELTHLREAWINWEQQQIQIPAHDPCTRACDGGDICGYCRDRAREKLENNPDLTIEGAWNRQWEPKTSNSVRCIPYDFDDDVRKVVESFTMFHDEWPVSRSTTNRRIDNILEVAGYSTSKCYPHALRATAANYHALRGVPPAALQSLFGWSQLSTAQKYVRLSGGATQRALRNAHSD